MPIALAAAIGVAAVTVVSARSDDDDCDGRKGHGGFGARFEELAELVGTDRDGLKTALTEGQTLAQIAEANGVEVQTVIDALITQVNERIDAWAEDGKLTEEEAETRKSDAAARIEDRVNNGFDHDNGRVWGKSRWRGHGFGRGVSAG